MSFSLSSSLTSWAPSPDKSLSDQSSNSDKTIDPSSENLSLKRLKKLLERKPFEPEHLVYSPLREALGMDPIIKSRFTLRQKLPYFRKKVVTYLEKYISNEKQNSHEISENFKKILDSHQGLIKIETIKNILNLEKVFEYEREDYNIAVLHQKYLSFEEPNHDINNGKQKIIKATHLWTRKKYILIQSRPSPNQEYQINRDSRPNPKIELNSPPWFDIKQATLDLFPTWNPTTPTNPETQEFSEYQKTKVFIFAIAEKDQTAEPKRYIQEPTYTLHQIPKNGVASFLAEQQTNPNVAIALWSQIVEKASIAPPPAPPPSRSGSLRDNTLDSEQTVTLSSIVVEGNTSPEILGFEKAADPDKPIQQPKFIICKQFNPRAMINWKQLVQALSQRMAMRVKLRTPNPYYPKITLTKKKSIQQNYTQTIIDRASPRI